jgi:hypothetical protein
MSEQEFESYLRLMGRFLKLNDRQRDAIKTELRDHMEERLDELMARGFSREEAIEAALDEFGDAAAIASDFGKIGRRRKWIMRTATSTVGLAATVLIVSFLLPENRPIVPAPDYTLAQDEPPSADAPQLPDEEMQVEHEEDDSRPRHQRAILDKVLPSLQFEETPFKEVVDYLHDQIDMNVYVNRHALNEEGIDTDMPITLNLKNVPFEQGLEFVLLEAAQGGDALAYALKGNVLIISTRDELDAVVETEVRIYDCRDLINGPANGATHEQARASNGPANSALAELLSESRPQSFTRPAPTPRTGPQPFVADGSVTDEFRLPTSLPPGNPMMILPTRQPAMNKASAAGEQRAKNFVNVITSTIASDSWQQEGGHVGSISEFDGFLIVRQTADGHEQIEDLLDMLRDAVHERAKVQKAHARHDDAVPHAPHDFDPKRGETSVSQDPFAPSPPFRDRPAPAPTHR